MRVGEKLSYNTIGEIGRKRNRPTAEHSDGPTFLSLNVQRRGEMKRGEEALAIAVLNCRLRVCFIEFNVGRSFW